MQRKSSQDAGAVGRFSRGNPAGKRKGTRHRATLLAQQLLALLGSQDRHNVLNKVALSVQVNMKADLREIYGAPARAAAEAATDVFADKYGR